MGKQAESLFDQFMLSEADQKDFDVVLAKFDNHFTPQKNFIHEHAIFNERVQLQGENVETYVRTLYELASRCDFGVKKEMCIRDRLVVGLADKTLSTELQLKKDLTLADAIEIARNSEQVKIQIFQQNPARESSKALDEVKHGKRKPFRRSQPQAYSQNNSQVNQNYSSGNRNHQRCTRCDRRHPPNSCPAMRAECNKCHRIGHYAKCCRTRVEKKKKVREVNFDSGDDTFFLGEV